MIFGISSAQTKKIINSRCKTGLSFPMESQETVLEQTDEENLVTPNSRPIMLNKNSDRSLGSGVRSRSAMEPYERRSKDKL
jgi:hypothetical protein